MFLPSLFSPQDVTIVNMLRRVNINCNKWKDLSKANKIMYKSRISCAVLIFKAIRSLFFLIVYFVVIFFNFTFYDSLIYNASGLYFANILLLRYYFSLSTLLTNLFLSNKIKKKFITNFCYFFNRFFQSIGNSQD